MTSEPGPGQLGDPNELASHLSALRGQVRRDRRATSLPLLVLGGATAVAFLPAVAMSTSIWNRPPGELVESIIIAAAFAAIWIAERHRAAATGVGTGRGFGRAALIGPLLLVIPGGLLVAILAGPFLAFALGLLIAGLTQRNRFLSWFGVLIGLLGFVNHYHWITNRLPTYEPWYDPAINLLLALLTVAAGAVIWRRESRAA